MFEPTANYISGRRFSMLREDGRTDLDHFTGLGAVAELEKRLANFFGMKHVICTSSATTALFSIGLALELRDADFITSPLNFGGSITPWLLLGNRPIFADVDSDTLTLDPSCITERLVTPKTRAILAVDLYGYPSDTAGLRRVADDLGLWYIADAAQAFGSRRGGAPASCMADAVVLSFNSQKSLAAGEGGCVLTNNTDLYQQLLWWSQHPMRQKRELGFDIYNEFSFNSRIHPAAAIAALGGFDLALERVTDHQELCFEAIRILENADLIDPTCLAALEVEPSFFALATRPKHRPQQCVDRLLDHGIEVAAANRMSSVLYKNPLYRRQFAGERPAADRCSAAEDAAARTTLSSLRRPRLI